MSVRNERTIKWLLFAGATVLFLLLQGFLLQHLSLWGVMPFLYPLLVALVGMWEGPLDGSIYGLVLGVLCDLTMVAPIPCFYTLLFPLVGLLSGVIAQSWLPPGVFCALLVSLLAFVLTDGFHCLLLAMTGRAAWSVAGLLAVKEFLITLPLALPIALLFWYIHRKCHYND